MSHRRERLHASIVADRRGQRVVISPHRDRDFVHASGEWIATDAVVDVRR